VRNTRSSLVIALVIACVIVSFAQVGVLPKKDVTLKTVSDSKFAVGDIWEYRTRPNEEASRLLVTRIDASPELGVIISIAVSGVRLANCHGGNEPDNIQHMPFARTVLDASVSWRDATGQPLPAQLVSAYDEWRSAYSDKKAGIYIVPLAEAVGITENTFREGIGCPSRK
jgi:hypothetical protein